jgi:hypothetical protein
LHTKVCGCAGGVPLKLSSRLTRASASLVVWSGALCTSCGREAPLDESESSVRASLTACGALSGSLTARTNEEIAAQLLLLGATPSASSRPFARSWRSEAGDRIAWILQDGTAVDLSPELVARLRSALASLQDRRDITSGQKLGVARALAAVGRGVSECASALPPEYVEAGVVNPAALAANARRARMDARMGGFLLKQLAAEFLRALPEDDDCRRELEALDLAIVADRAAVAEAFRELEATLDAAREAAGDSSQ